MTITSTLETTVLENPVSVSVARRHGEGRVALVGGVGGQVLTQRDGLLQLGGDGGRRARQSVTWGEATQKVTTFSSGSPTRRKWFFKEPCAGQNAGGEEEEGLAAVLGQRRCLQMFVRGWMDGASTLAFSFHL